MPVLESIQELLDGAILKRIHRYNMMVGENNANRDRDIISVTIVK
jgi:hypothetical protein